MTESESVALPLGDIAILFRTQDIITESEDFVNTFLKFFLQNLFLFCFSFRMRKNHTVMHLFLQCRLLSLNFFEKTLKKPLVLWYNM